jgi:hypothetical protein
MAGTTTGEWTPDYFYQPWVPPLLAEAAPRAKLLLILRDPVQRFRSGLAHQLRTGADHVGAAQAEAVNMSLYADSLRRWHKAFPADQLLVLQYEACTARPLDHLETTYEFLGLDPTFRPDDLRAEVNKSTETKASLTEDARRRLEDVLAPDIDEVAALVPTLDLSLWPSANRHGS